MTFTTWFSLVAGTIAAIAGVLACLQNHKSMKRFKEKAKADEWAVTRLDYDQWIVERKDSRKVYLHGYVISQFTGNFETISKVFNDPILFVKGFKFGISEELNGEDWDLTLYYVDVTYDGVLEAGQFPKDADNWVDRLV